MATIAARDLWTCTPFQLQEGRRYRFVSEGKWTDGRMPPCPGTGYESCMLAIFGWMRRRPSAKWFSIVGEIDKKRATQFDVGRLIENGETYQATATGTLYCYPNDVRCMYWNNTGAVNLEMQPVD